MLERVIRSLLLSIIVVATGLSNAAEKSGYDNWVEMEAALVKDSIWRQWVPMRDGIRLDTNIFLPKGREERHPVILIRVPYPDEALLNIIAKEALVSSFLENGYALIYQTERGRYWSEGEYSFLARAGEDGYDTVDWIARQPWSNGRVGTIGCSSSAEHQLALSVASHPAHVAAIVQAPGAAVGKIGPYVEQGNFYRGGVPQLLHASWYHDYAYYGGDASNQRPRFPSNLDQEDRIRLSRLWRLWPEYGWGVPRIHPDGQKMDYHQFFSTLPLSSIMSAVAGPKTDWDDFIIRTPLDPAWSDTPFANEGDQFGVPMLWVFSWYDVSTPSNVAMYNYARDNTSTQRARDNQFMVIGPMAHCDAGEESRNTVVGERQLGDARFDYNALFLSWFDRWLKEKRNGFLKKPRVQYYQMGSNEWLSGDRFPPQGTRFIDYYMDSSNGANSLYGDGTLSRSTSSVSDFDSFYYDPLRPVPSLGGSACCMGDIEAAGAFDQSHLEIRNDILVYTSPALKEDLKVAGFVEVELYVSSDAKDTDFSVKFIDVDTEGRAWNLDDSIFRVRYREGYEQQVFMEEDKIYRINFSPLITANTFKKGHRVRVEISSSNFPRYGRNMNTGGKNYDEAEGTIAHNRVHHSVKYPSRIRIPITH